MLSIRTRIRQAIVQHLQCAFSLKANIKIESSIPITLQDLPLITVALDKANLINDWTAIGSKGELLEMVEQGIMIRITAAGHSELEEKLEQIAAMVSQILAQDETLGGLVKTLHLDEEVELCVSHEGEQPIGILTIQYTAIYRRSSQADLL